MDNNAALNKASSILPAYGLNPAECSVSPLGSGYIHLTFLVQCKTPIVLQRVNKNVFTNPEIIASNLKAAADHLKVFHPDYRFLQVVTTLNGKQMVYDQEGFPWRAFPFIDHTYTINHVTDAKQAFSAASEFARLVRNLSGADIKNFHPTIDRFHDLKWRYEQFEDSLKNASQERLVLAAMQIQKAKDYKSLVDTYNGLIKSGEMKLRVTHNDTKINNILFSSVSHQAVCTIDLDTLMPGYFIYDIGDMIRTFVSPVDEEEKDISKIVFRPEVYRAIVDGYLSQMADELAETERAAIPFGGMMMTYIMALRMLADYLNGDVYYNIRYKDQNLVRATNQFALLDVLLDNIYSKNDSV